MADQRGRGPLAVAAERPRTDQEVTAMLQSAMAHALRRRKITTRAAAHRMRVAQSTIARYLSGESDVSIAKVLRSRRIAKHFIGCLALLNGRQP
jgi:predicted transcriptional regulator